MAKKKTKLYTVSAKTEKHMVIDMKEIQHKAAPFNPVCFKTGAHTTAKDRPRKKRWSIDD